MAGRLKKSGMAATQNEKQRAEAAGTGVIGSIQHAGTAFAAVINGIDTAITAYSNGAGLVESVGRGTAHAFGTFCSIGNLAGLSDKELVDIGSAAFVDFVFGTASSSMSSAISKVCDDRHKGTDQNRLKLSEPLASPFNTLHVMGGSSMPISSFPFKETNSRVIFQ